MSGGIFRHENLDFWLNFIENEGLGHCREWSDNGIRSSLRQNSDPGFADTPVVYDNLNHTVQSNEPKCVFLSYRDETKKAHYTEELESVTDIKNLFYNAFSQSIDLEYLHNPGVKVYIQDQQRPDVFFELEEIGDIKPQCLLKIHEQVTPAFASPGSLSTNGISQSLANLDKRKFDERLNNGDSEAESEPATFARRGYVNCSPNRPIQQNGLATEMKPPPAKPKRVFVPSKHRIQDTLDHVPARGQANHRQEPMNYLTNERSSVTPSRSGSATPIVDEEARARMINMEKQLASLSALVHHALMPSKSVSDAQKLPNRDDISDCGSLSRFSDLDSEKSMQFMTENTGNEPSPYGYSIKSSNGSSNRTSSCNLVTTDTRNSLKSLKRRTREIQVEVKSLRRMVQLNSQNARDILKDAFDRIKVILNTNQHLQLFAIQAQRQNEMSRSELGLPAYLIEEQQKHNSNMIKMEDDLESFERLVDETRDKVVNGGKKLRIDEVERFTEILTNIIRMAADVKSQFPFLQEKVRAAISVETDKVLQNKIRNEPKRLDEALKRCKKLTGTIITMKKLAMVQDAGRNGISQEKTPIKDLKGVSFANSQQNTANRTTPQVAPISSALVESSDRGRVLDGLVEELHNVGDVSKRGLSLDQNSMTNFGKSEISTESIRKRSSGESSNSDTIKRSPKSIMPLPGEQPNNGFQQKPTTPDFDENMNFLPKSDTFEILKNRRTTTNFRNEFTLGQKNLATPMKQRAMSPKTVLPTHEFTCAASLIERPRSTTPLSSGFYTSEWTENDLYKMAHKPPTGPLRINSSTHNPPSTATSRGNFASSLRSANQNQVILASSNRNQATFAPSNQNQATFASSNQTQATFAPSCQNQATFMPSNQNQATFASSNQKTALNRGAFEPTNEKSPYLKYNEFRPRPIAPMVQTNAMENDACIKYDNVDLTKVASSNESINSQDTTMLLAYKGKKPPPPPPPRNKQEMLEQRQHELMAKQLRYQLDGRL